MYISPLKEQEQTIYNRDLLWVMFSSEEDAFIKSQVKHAGQDLTPTKKLI